MSVPSWCISVGEKEAAYSVFFQFCDLALSCFVLTRLPFSIQASHDRRI